jgi:hypothetical protein
MGEDLFGPSALWQFSQASIVPRCTRLFDVVGHLLSLVDDIVHVLVQGARVEGSISSGLLLSILVADRFYTDTCDHHVGNCDALINYVRLHFPVSVSQSNRKRIYCGKRSLQLLIYVDSG